MKQLIRKKTSYGATVLVDAAEVKDALTRGLGLVHTYNAKGQRCRSFQVSDLVPDNAKKIIDVFPDGVTLHSYRVVNAQG